MNNQNIMRKITDEYAGIDENLSGSIWEKIENTLDAKNSVSARENKKQRMPMKRFVLIAAAIMLSFTMLVSAVTIAYNIYNGMYMLPGMGLFDGFNDNVRTMPKVLEFGDATIEMAMSYDYGESCNFYMTIYAEGGGYTNKRPEKGDYENLEILFSDGTSILLESKPSQYYFMYDYEYENFPDECEFILKNNKGMSTEVKLAPIEARTMRITDNGLKRIKMIPAAEGSRIFSYNVEIITPSAAENEAKYAYYQCNLRSWDDVPDCGIFYKNGTVLKNRSVSTRGSLIPIFTTDEDADYKYYTSGELYFQSDYINSEIDKIIIREIGVHLYSFGDRDLTKVILPVPENGERFDYDAPLEIAKIGEFTLYVDAIERNKNNLLIHTSSDRCMNYSGNEDISKITFSFANSRSSYTYNEDVNIYKYIHTIKIPENYFGDMFETAIFSIEYSIHDYWEINFG